MYSVFACDEFQDPFRYFCLSDRTFCRQLEARLSLQSSPRTPVNLIPASNRFALDSYSS